jgi:hypothetical protein
VLKVSFSFKHIQVKMEHIEVHAGTNPFCAITVPHWGSFQYVIFVCTTLYIIRYDMFITVSNTYNKNIELKV